jgi:iron complex transport system substrate-binding protein
MDSIKEDLEKRTASLSWMEKPSVYVGGISYKGAHGFEGTEAGYGPLAAIHADNLADKTGKEGAFDIDPEQVLSWDPEVIFLDYNGINLIKEDYASNPEYYQQLTAVQEGRVYSQISFRSSAANLDTALADTYYAASILYPEAFGDIDPVKKAEEIFEKLLGRNFYEDLKENGYEFRKINIGE